MTRDEINAFGEAIQREMLDNDGAILVDVAALAPSASCDLNSCTATVSGFVGGEEQLFTSHAIYLHDAILMARGKLHDARKSYEAAKAEAKKKAAVA